MPKRNTYNKCVTIRLSDRDLRLLKARAERLSIGMNALLRMFIQMPIHSDRFALKLKPLFASAEIYRTHLDSIRVCSHQLDADTQKLLRHKAILARDKLLNEVELLRTLSELGRLNERTL